MVRAVLDGRADAGAVGSPFWNSVRSERLVPQGGLSEIWSSPSYNHCMFTSGLPGAANGASIDYARPHLLPRYCGAGPELHLHASLVTRWHPLFRSARFG